MSGFEDDIADLDIAVFEDLGEVPVTYTPEGGSAIETSGMFDRTYEELGNGQARVDSAGPSVLLQLAALAPGHPDTDKATLTINGANYRYRKTKPDGSPGSAVRLFLHKVS